MYIYRNVRNTCQWKGVHVCVNVYITKNHHRSLYVHLLYHTVYNFAVVIKII